MPALPTNRTIANTAAEHVADHNWLHSLGVLGYAQVVATQSGLAAEVDVTGLSVAVTVGSTRRIKVTASVSISGAVGNGIAISIQEGATKLQDATVTLAASSLQDTLTAYAILSPSAGAHTYKVTARRFSGAATFNVFAAATTPAFILVEDIGSA